MLCAGTLQPYVQLQEPKTLLSTTLKESSTRKRAHRPPQDPAGTAAGRTATRCAPQLRP